MIETMTQESIETAPTFEQHLSVELTKFNMTDAAIEKYREDYMGLKVIDYSDKKQLKTVSDARKVIKSARVSVEKTGKTLREDALKWQRAVLAEETRIIKLLEPIEKYLEKEESRAEKEIARIKKEKEMAEARRISERTHMLVQAGMVFIPGNQAYALPSNDKYEILFSEIGIKSDEQFKLFVDEVRSINESAIATAEAERKKKEEENNLMMEKIAKQREALEKQQRDLEELQKNIRIEQERLEVSKNFEPVITVTPPPFVNTAIPETSHSFVLPPAKSVPTDKDKLTQAAHLLATYPLPDVQDDLAKRIVSNTRGLLIKVADYIRDKSQGLK